MEKIFIILCIWGLLWICSGCEAKENSNNNDGNVTMPTQRAANNPSANQGENKDTTLPINEGTSTMPEASKPFVEGNGYQEGNMVFLAGDDGKYCELALWMTEEEVLDRLQNADIILEEDTEDRFMSKVYSNENFLLNFSLGTDENSNEVWILWVISVLTPLVETEHGLKIGDIEEKIEKLAGTCEETNYNENTGETSYLYFGGEEAYTSYRMNIFVSNGKISGWSIVPQP